MGQNAHLSWSRGDFLDNLARDLATHCPLIGRLESYVISMLSEEDRTIVRRYFLLYTAPVLEISGLTTTADWERLCLWGLVQTRLGVHLRYLDNIVDGDRSVSSSAAVLLAAHHLLTDAKRLLSERSFGWGALQDDIYGQFLAFESENRAGFHHDFDSLWRRVSPLCVIPETYLAESIPNSLALAYREYLAWTLLQADCDDGLEDLRAGVETPITWTLRTSLYAVHRDWDAGARAINEIKRFLKRRLDQTVGVMAGYPVWMTIITHLEEAFIHEEVPL